ncbi:hypothetical protein [Blastococcus tunisiensis]|uniref:hypothetical protein n=1 Tax=Blastococcus tunisiensis TaxID=1798228 RepID=UPI00111344B1|nr:hypothetical protein [Blastococcus sp. DSM 46838]
MTDWINTDFGALVDAWSRTWAYGSADGVRLANRLLDSCGHVMAVISTADATGFRQRIRQVVLGISNEPLVAEWDRRMKKVATARRELAEYMRSETGRPAAELFSLPEPTPSGETALG